MKKLLFITLLFLIGVGGKAQNYEWAFNVGGAVSDAGCSIITDASGNVYVTGYFAGTADFNPGAGTAFLTSDGNRDGFVAKYDAAGNYLWAFKLGGTGDDEGWGISLNSAGSGYVYVTGFFENTADFDPSGNTANLTSNDSRDIYIAKYDAAGNYLWAFNVGGASWDHGYSIAVDTAGAGDVYVTGFITDTVDFDPSLNTAILTSNGIWDIFIAKYDAAGNYLWAFSVGGVDGDEGKSISIDPIEDVVKYWMNDFSQTNRQHLESKLRLDNFRP